MVAAKLLSLAVVFLLVQTEYCHAQNLYVIERKGQYGFSDRSGKEVIPPNYSAVKTFSEGLAAVYQDGKWGCINVDGKVEISFQFQEVEGFSNGLAAVRKEQWGFINRNGKEAILFRVLDARPFSEGLAPVKDHDGWLFIDDKGAPVSGLTGFDDAKCFAEGLAPVQVGDKWRFITPKGVQSFPQEYNRAASFSDHLAVVQQKEDGKYGFIDRSGRYVVDPTFDDARPFAEGFAAGRVNKRWGYIGTSGESRIAKIFPFFAGDFAQGLAAVSSPVDGSAVYVDADGRSQFFKSRKPTSVERGTSDYSMVRLEASSSPPSADVYLVPAYIWDLGDNNATPPSHFDESVLIDFMQEHFDYLQGKTNLQKDIIEQKYTVLFVLGKNTKKRTLDARIGVNHISETFDHR
jgi:hypothetical protein